MSKRYTVTSMNVNIQPDFAVIMSRSPKEAIITFCKVHNIGYDSIDKLNYDDNGKTFAVTSPDKEGRPKLCGAYKLNGLKL